MGVTIPTVEKACVCLDLKTGTIILGVINLVCTTTEIICSEVIFIFIRLDASSVLLSVLPFSLGLLSWGIQGRNLMNCSFKWTLLMLALVRLK